MDLTSFAAASKAANDLNKIKKDLGSGIKSTYSNLKLRLDQVEADIDKAYVLTNTAILNNALNIAKANEKLNAVIKASKYNLKQMVFDDFYDLSGVEISSLTEGYIHYPDLGLLKTGEFTTKPIALSSNQQYMLFDIPGSIKIEVSFDNDYYVAMTDNKINYLTDKQKTANSMIVKATCVSGGQFNYYAAMWA